MMSSHRATIEMIQNKIEELNKDYGTALSQRNAAKANLERKEKDVQLIEHELAELGKSLALLTEDAQDAIAEAPC
jgi:recombinational DNA repair ATPase RecF